MTRFPHLPGYCMKELQLQYTRRLSQLMLLEMLKVKVAQPSPTLCGPMDYGVRGIL